MSRKRNILEEEKLKRADVLALDIPAVSSKLKDLNEHNAQARNMQWAMNDNNPRLNGIACPKCGEELYDSNPMITLTSMPAQKNVHCSKCDYVGYRIA